MTQGQLAWYREMEARGELVAGARRATRLERHLAALGVRRRAATRPSGTSSASRGRTRSSRCVTSSGRSRQGLRAVGPAHYGPGTYAQGTDAEGGIGARGRELLREMERLGRHSRRHAPLRPELLGGARRVPRARVGEPLELPRARAAQPPVLGRADPRARRPRRRDRRGARCLDDRAGWERGRSTPATAGVTLDRLIDHVDHICQVAGNARHVGIGSDLDGAFGREQTATDIETIADLARIPHLLRARGYGERGHRGHCARQLHRLPAAWGDSGRGECRA